MPLVRCHATDAVHKDPDGEQYNEQQELTCAATGGTFTLTFRGFTTGAIDYSASSEDIVASLEAIPSIYSSYDTAVSVQYSTSETEACTSAGHSWTIEFLQDFGDVPLLVSGVSKLTHSASGTTASVAIEEAVAGTKESDDCSGRGLCDTDDRVCTCEPEFGTSNGYNEEVYPYVSSSLLFGVWRKGRCDIWYYSSTGSVYCSSFHASVLRSATRRKVSHRATLQQC